MFPINWNDIFRKKDGTLGTMEELGGSSLPEYSSSDAGKVLGVDDEGGLEWNDVPSELPEYSSSEAGKVLGVDNDGLLEWNDLPTPPTGTKIYYKDYSVPNVTNVPLAKFSDGEASASGYNICYFNVYPYAPVSIAGYTPISAMAIDNYTGYGFNVSLSVSGNAIYLSIGIANRSIDSGSLTVRVFYVKNENYEQIPTS